MRFSRLIAVPTLSLLTLVGCASSGASMGDADETYEPTAAELHQEEGYLASTTPLSGDSATLEVRGLSCPKCASNVDLTLARVKGVESVTKIDLSKGTVRLAFADDVRPSPSDLAKAVKKSGFTLVNITTP